MVLVAPGGFIRKSCRSLTSGISQATSSPPPYSAKLDNHPQQQHHQYHQLTSILLWRSLSLLSLNVQPGKGAFVDGKEVVKVTI